MRFCLLGSGSTGNALLVESHGTRLLVDSGLSYRQLEVRLAAVGQSLEGLRAVFVTHEHADHVHGLGTLARRTEATVYMTPGTRAALPPGVGQLPRVELIEAGDRISLNGLTVTSFSVSHDAADPVSYVIEDGRAKLGLAADLGYASELVKQRLTGSHALILESNYCPAMLRHGNYPPLIQQRIRGRQGHLSNKEMSSLLAQLAHEALRLVVLVHISEENNTAELAYRMAERAIRGHRAAIHVAPKHQPTPLFELTS